MDHQTVFHNGMTGASLGHLSWVKSGRSGPQGNCVELAELEAGGRVAMRNSRDTRGPVLVHERDEIQAFIEAAKSGDFDHLLA